MKSEHATHLELVQDSEQNHQPQHQVKLANKAARDAKAEINSQFWRRVRHVCNFAALIVLAKVLFIIFWS
ncbi:hypothetical protein ACPESL_08080 [Psychrobacter pocilloporae]|uniref:hypothetical protein n=1 Tax=Psychrobacter pocilloporae TaxID=1775882 RepID=UPI003C2D6524